MKIRAVMVVFAIGGVMSIAEAGADGFRFLPPGELLSASGKGAKDTTVYAPDITFPIDGNAYANSQVWRPGGGKGGAGGQCAAANYTLPWQDNFCETRSRKTAMCPSGQGHQGQDIRPPSCKKDVHWAVAAETGFIGTIGKYTVTLVGESGTHYRYLHLNMDKLAVSSGDTVKPGDRIGLVSNHFDGTPTTIHLHFEIHRNLFGSGLEPVPPYMSLVRAYERRIVTLGRVLQ